jgi:AmmeMemoRadiSam system protein B
MNEIRPSPIAGMWYPGNPKQLTSEINNYLSQVQQNSISDDILALVVPHAGYRYSGKTAAYAYKTVAGKAIETIFLLSPYHDFHPAEVISTAHSAYQTPLGDISINLPIQQAINGELLQKTGHAIQPVRRDREHSLEIQLPFLQTVLPQPFSIVPLMVRSRDRLFCQQLGEIIANHFDPQIHLLIASTDLSHFYPEQAAHQFDQTMLAMIKALDPDGVFTAEEQEKGFACGAGALAATLWAAKKLQANQCDLLYYTTSAEITHDTQSVVGYGAAVIYKSS